MWCGIEWVMGEVWTLITFMLLKLLQYYNKCVHFLVMFDMAVLQFHYEL